MPPRRPIDVHRIDEAAAAARDTAHVVAAFWRELVREGVPEQRATDLAADFLEYVFPDKRPADVA